jgi:hypothetical protein
MLRLYEVAYMLRLYKASPELCHLHVVSFIIDYKAMDILRRLRGQLHRAKDWGI